MKVKCGNCGEHFYDIPDEGPFTITTLTAAWCHACDWLGPVAIERQEDSQSQGELNG